jgi:hypothetical protein
MLGALPSTGCVVDWGEQRYYCGGLEVPTSGGKFYPNSAKFEVVGMSRLAFKGRPTFLIDNRLPDRGTISSGGDLWRFIDCPNLKLDIVAVSDHFDPSRPQGVCAVTLVADRITWGDCDLRVNAKNCYAALQTCRKDHATSTQNPNNVVGVRCDLTVANAEYGFRALNAGYHITARISADHVVRSYFVVGAQEHFVSIRSRSAVKFMDVLIKAYSDPVRNIRVDLLQRASEAQWWPISIEHQSEGDDTVIEDISIIADIRQRRPRLGLRGNGLAQVGRSLDAAGNTRKQSNCITTKIKIQISSDETDVKQFGVVFPSRTRDEGFIETNLPVIGDANNFTVQPLR